MMDVLALFLWKERRKTMTTENPILKTEKLAELNRAMLGLGAPIERDGQGYNKPDFARMEGIGRLRDEMSFEEAYHVVQTLQHYKNTQLKTLMRELEATKEYYEKEMEKQHPQQFERMEVLKCALEGEGHTQGDYLERELTFVRLESGKVCLAFAERVNIDIRDFNGYWRRDDEDRRYIAEIPVEKINDFLGTARTLGHYGYTAPKEMLEAVEKYKSEMQSVKPDKKITPNVPKTKEFPPKELPPAVLLPTGEKNQYGLDIYVLTRNEYAFNQKLWTLKGTGLKYVDSRSEKDSVRISTTPQLLPVLLEFLKDCAVDVSPVENAPVIDKNKSGNVLIDVNTLKLPFTPFPFQLEDARTVVGKKKALLGHDMGCVAGKSKVCIKEHGSSEAREVCIETLFELFQKDSSIQIKSLRSGRFVYMPIKAVIDKGVRDTIRIETDLKYCIECTPDHEFYTEKGWVEAKRLFVADIVFSVGLPENVPRRAAVTNIQRATRQRVYDIAIDDLVTHNFVCDGIVVHNCGKTFISALVGMSLPGKKLVICPETLRLNWKRELEQTDGVNHGADIKVVYSKDKAPQFGGDWTIMGYKTAVKFAALIKDEKFNCMFVDEAHKCKAVNNYGKPTSKQAQTVMELSKAMDYTYLLTGTPMPTRNKDLYNELVMLGEIDPDVPHAFSRFGIRYCDGHNNGFGWDFDGSSNVEELHEILGKYMTRRLKSDVLPDLKKQRIPIMVEAPLSREYKNIEERLYDMKDGDTYMALAMTGRRYLSKCKVKEAMDFADTLLEDGESVVMVAEFNETLDRMMEHFGEKACCIRGGMSDREKQLAVDSFQSGEKQVCCINLIAAGVGITLTKSRSMVICDYDWTPANMTQVEDRICRTGQDKPCNIFYILHSKAVLDDIFLQMLTSKSANIDQVVDQVENTVDLVGMKESGAANDFLASLKKRVGVKNNKKRVRRKTRDKQVKSN